MNLRPQRTEPPEINLAPLIDVVFLLLIFFMVTTSFRDEVGIKIRLPEAAGEAAAEAQPLTLTIDAEGSYYVNDLQVADRQPATLSKALMMAMANARGRDQATAGGEGLAGQAKGPERAGGPRPPGQGGTGGQADQQTPVGDASAGTAVRTTTTAPADLPLVLKADARTPHQAVMTAMDVASRLGLTRLSFAASHSQDPP